MALEYFTLVHVLISIVGIAAGFGALAGLLAGQIFQRWTQWHLGGTLLTCVTGFFFPFRGFTPAIGVGMLSIVLLAAAFYALYFRHLFGIWRTVFVVGSVGALYFNFFVLVAQLFQKMPVLQRLAPTQSEPPFAVSQLLVLATFLYLGYAALKRLPATELISGDHGWCDAAAIERRREMCQPPS